MRNKILLNHPNSFYLENETNVYPSKLNNLFLVNSKQKLPEILFITTYPPRECGIATYSQDLIKALNSKFQNSFNIKIGALESNNEQHVYTDSIKYILNTDYPNAFSDLVKNINDNADIDIVLLQHEFGLFKKNENDLITFLKALQKPAIIVLHTVLPNPNEFLKANVSEIASIVQSIIVMTNAAAQLLINDYKVDSEKITVIPHGTHLVEHSDKELLKEKYQLKGKKILSTFGLLSSGKSIETTLEALPNIIKKNKDVLFLIIGKTHPSVVKQEGEKYRMLLEEKIKALKLQNHVKFINCFLPLSELLEYLQLTDIYLFTSKDPNQAVSGTFSYALSCGCPIISTPIPHACELLKDNAGIIIDFENASQMAQEVNNLLLNKELRKNISSNGLHKIAPTAWENSAIAHAMVFKNNGEKKFSLHFKIPDINLNHIKKMTTHFGMIQFSKINKPDIDSGYTLDDNARALIAICQHYKLTKKEDDLKLIKIYLDFIKYCQIPEGDFLNYVSEDKEFTNQNNTTNLEDSNGRAIWSLGYLISLKNSLPEELIEEASIIMQKALQNCTKIHSTRAMAFIIKGLYYKNIQGKNEDDIAILKVLANRLVQMYRHESEEEWNWFESYFTYANSILPEALLCAWLTTGDEAYKEIAQSTFDFLLGKIFTNNRIKVISNKGWLHKKNEYVPVANGGEQPIDVSYTILALSKFYSFFKDKEYKRKLEIAFDWFLGNNHLNQIIYNPCTGGCYDGIEESNVNLNQGAESTVSYLMARLTLQDFLNTEEKSNRVKNYKKNTLAKVFK